MKFAKNCFQTTNDEICDINCSNVKEKDIIIAKIAMGMKVTHVDSSDQWKVMKLMREGNGDIITTICPNLIACGLSIHNIRHRKLKLNHRLFI